jgi:hypothetical protein
MRMRRLVVLSVSLALLVVPAAALAELQHSGDGTLVVRNADNGDGADPGARPVVTLVIHGSVVGQVGGLGRIAIYNLDPAATSDVSVSGTAGSAVWHKDISTIATVWGGTGFRFRAVGGTFRVVIRGSDVDLFAIGYGNATLTGQPDTPSGDGQYSLNGKDFQSIPLELSRPVGTPIGTPTGN